MFPKIARGAANPTNWSFLACFPEPRSPACVNPLLLCTASRKRINDFLHQQSTNTLLVWCKVLGSSICKNQMSKTGLKGPRKTSARVAKEATNSPQGSNGTEEKSVTQQNCQEPISKAWRNKCELPRNCFSVLLWLSS